MRILLPALIVVLAVLLVAGARFAPAPRATMPDVTIGTEIQAALADDTATWLSYTVLAFDGDWVKLKVAGRREPRWFNINQIAAYYARSL
jgi:hypothetical protein